MQYHLLITLPIYILLHVGLFGVFRKAGEAGWKAFVPGLNLYVWMQIIGRPTWWMIWFLIPVVNFIMGIGIVLDMVRSYNKHRFVDQALAVLFPYFYFIYLGFNKKDEYQGKWQELAETKTLTKSPMREWLDAILFAGTAALIIRTLLIEAFMIPTTSMEGSLLAGDFLFVSKFHYGIRLPQAPLSFPFVHNTLPLTKGTKSYLPVELPYSRLPGIKHVQRNEIVVFNYPDDDRNPDVPELGKINITSMKQNYIKRCVAVAGDSLEIRAGHIFINGKPGWESENMQTSYIAGEIGIKVLKKEGFRANYFKGGGADPNNNAQGIDMNPLTRQPMGAGSSHWVLHMNATKFAEMKSKYSGTKFEPLLDKPLPEKPRNINVAASLLTLRKGGLKELIYPKVPGLTNWSKDNFGPIYLPKKGVTVKLDPHSLLMYEKIIDVYEKHDLDVSADGTIKIDGKVTTEYTFAMNYYWMMGDNRHASLDSRFWGYVPEDHVIGRPWFVLFSWEEGPRWSRFFRPISSWEPGS
ncbi:MAG TPA: signal peptidase I [Bacteroidetes bacterium]|nr:signal peptidase I [Bacteroidota bacterium]